MSGLSRISQTYSSLMSSIQKSKDCKSKKVCAITFMLNVTVNVISIVTLLLYSVRSDSKRYRLNPRLLSLFKPQKRLRFNS